VYLFDENLNIIQQKKNSYSNDYISTLDFYNDEIRCFFRNETVDDIFTDNVNKLYMRKIYPNGTDLTIQYASQSTAPQSLIIPSRFVQNSVASKTLASGVLENTMTASNKSGRVLVNKIIADNNVEVVEPLVTQLTKG
jgi:hypothetical protein